MRSPRAWWAGPKNAPDGRQDELTSAAPTRHVHAVRLTQDLNFRKPLPKIAITAISGERLPNAALTAVVCHGVCTHCSARSRSRFPDI